LRAWLMALSSSCVSTSEVMSNEGMTCFYAEARVKGIRNPRR
jgi:hypothetical protein